MTIEKLICDPPTPDMGQVMVSSMNSLIDNPFNALKPSTVTLFGDSYSSLQQDSTSQSNTVNSTYSSSIWHMLLAMLGDAVVVNTYAGIGGNTSALMLARIQADVLDIGDEYVFMQLGSVNDFFPFSVSAVDVFTSVKAMVDLIVGNGQKIYGQNTLPQDPSRGDYSAAKAIQVALFDEMIAEYVRITPGIIMGDGYSFAADPSDNSTGGAMANKWIGTDKIHPNIFGAYEFGVNGLEDIGRYFPAPRHRKLMSAVTAGDYWGFTESNFNGNTGSLGTGATGDVPTGWILKRQSGTGSVDGSFVDGDYNATITLSGASSSVYRIQSNDINSLFTGGENIKSKLIISFDMTLGIVLEEIRCYWYTDNGTVFKTTDWGRSVNGYTARSMPELIKDIQIDIQPSIMPDAPLVDVNFFIDIRVSGTGTGIIIPKHLRILDA